MRTPPPALHFSRTGGACWEQFASLPADVTAHAPILLAPRSDGSPRFLTTNFDEQIYRTGDFGQSWLAQKLPGPPTFCYDACDDMRLAAAPPAPTQLYAAVNDLHSDLFGAVPYAFLFASQDAGVTWAATTMPGRGSPFSTISSLFDACRRSYLPSVAR